MKKFIITVVTILSLYSSLFILTARSQWIFDYNISTYNYEKIDYFCMVDTLSVWGIGTLGASEDTSFIYKLKPPGIWYRLPMQSFMNSQLTCIAAHDTSKAWVGTYDGEIYMTTNGGYNWEMIFSFGGSSFINDIKFSKTNNLIGYANSDPPNGSGTPFKILKTTNGGLNWVTLSPIFANNYYGAMRSSCVTDENHYWMGLSCSYCGVPKLAFTTNGGVNWQQKTLQISNHFVVPIEFTTDNSLGYCSSFGGSYIDYIHRTTDGGFSWSNYYVLPIENGQPLNSLNWIEGTRNWYFSSSSISLDAIYKSTNNGNNWNPMVINNDHDQVINLSFIRKNNSIWGYASTYNGKIFKLIRDTAVISIHTVTGTVKYSDNNQPVSGGYVKALKLNYSNMEMEMIDSTGIQSNGTYILPNVRTDSVYIRPYPNSTPVVDFIPTYYPSSITWENATVLYVTSNLNNIDVGVIRANIATTSSTITGSVFKTTYNPLPGLKDVLLYAKLNNEIRGFTFSNNDGYYLLNNMPSGTYNIYSNRPGYKSDSIAVYMPSGGTLNNINFTLYPFWTSIKKLESGIITEYRLEQNYPNPFNSKTKIKFEVKKSGNVKLKVFDITGKLVADIVDSELETGRYEVLFDAKNLSSSIYFYRLTTGDFTETKRMIHIK